jgi:hypothetical protein
MIHNNEERRYCMELALVSFKNINKRTIKVFNTPYITVLQVLFRECFPRGYCKPSG